VLSEASSFAFFFFFSSAAETALLTLSTSSRLCSRYSVSSNRCFLPANLAGSSVVEEPVLDDPAPEELSIPSLRSSACSFAFCASALAASRSGSDSRYSASFFCLLYCTQSSTTEIPARVIVVRLLTTHSSTCSTKLGPKTSLSSKDSWRKTK